MKFRSGFVSNSSSASYIVELGVEYDTLLEKLSDDCYPFTWPSEVEQLFQSRINSLNERIESLENGEREHFILQSIDKLRETRDELQYQLNFISNRSTDRSDPDRLVRFTEFCLEFFEVKVTAKWSGGVKLEGQTVMHNNFTESIPHMLQEIVLANLFSWKYHMKCTWKPDN